VGVGEGDELPERVRRDDGVVVQKEDVLAPGAPGCLIAGPGESQVPVVAD
jgi:hypothetical protein